MNLRRFAILLTMLLFGLIIAMGSFAENARAQTVTPPTTFSPEEYCAHPEKTVTDNKTHIAAKSINQIIAYALKNFVTNGSLRFRLRCDPLIKDAPATSTTPIRYSVYSFTKNLVNFGVMIILLVIAFANILRIKLDTYAAKKAIPLLIFGVIMSNVGLPLIRSAVDVSDILTVGLIQQTSPDGTKTGFVNEVIRSVYQGGATAVGNTLTSVDNGPVGWSGALALVGITGFAIGAIGPAAAILFGGAMILLILPAIMFFTLGIMLIVRIYVIVLLAAVSPLAFASLGFTPLKGKVWSRWWKEFINWTFMVPATFALLWLATRFRQAVGDQMDIGTYVVTLGLMAAAVQIPLKWGGEIMSKWNAAVVKPINNALNAPVKGTLNYVKTASGRDITRTLNKRGLNIVRNFRDVAGELERRATEADSNSRSVQLSRQINAISFNGTRPGLRNLINRRNWQGGAGTGNYQSVAGLQTAENRSNEFLNQFDGAATEFHTLQPTEAGRFATMTNDAIQSNDTDRMIGAYFANARAGRHMSNDERDRLFRALNANGVTDTSTIERKFNRFMAEKQFKIGGATTEGIQGFTPQNEEARKQAFSKRVERELRNVSLRDKPQAYALMERALMDSSGHVLSRDQLENNTTLFGYARALLNNAGDPNMGSVSSGPVMTQLQQWRQQLAATHAEHIVTTPGDRTLLEATIRGVAGVPATTRVDFIDPLFEPYRIADQADWNAAGTDEQRDAIQAVCRGNLDTIKTNLLNKVQTEVNAAATDLGLNATQRADLLALASTAIAPGTAGNGPTPITDILVDGVVGNNATQTAHIMARLRGYNGIAQNFETLRGIGII